mmetsp:Transcript_5713/g.12056  ORF Transcript_5713/g.12056 Transcript_5713/m.12056 type:complete len:81 (-) Transcript_5713:1741-1983(-)
MHFKASIILFATMPTNHMCAHIIEHLVHYRTSSTKLKKVYIHMLSFHFKRRLKTLFHPRTRIIFVAKVKECVQRTTLTKY